MNAADQIAGQLVAEKIAILQEAPRLVARAVSRGWARFPVVPVPVVAPATPTASSTTDDQLPEIQLADLRKWVAVRGLTNRQAAEALGCGHRQLVEALRGVRKLRGRLPR